jgi:hypothetical protein
MLYYGTMLYYALMFLVASLIAGALNLAGVSMVAAAECQVTEDGGTIQGLPTWKGATLSILPLTITVEREIYGGLIPSPVLEVAPYMKSNRIVLGKTENQGMATIGACLSQDLRKSALFNHAMVRSLVKSPAKAHTQFMNVPALLYNGKRQALTIRTTPPEIGISARYKADPLIGPVQEIRKSVLSENRTVSQAIATRPSTVESPSPFGGQASVASNPFLRALQGPDNVALRMNLTTEQVLQGGTCARGCP